jgi:putative nucleotidyltransferase with HDIG domain
MFDALARLQLKRKGFSCGRTRRKQTDSALLQVLWENPWVKVLIFVGFTAGVVALVLYANTPEAPFSDSPLRAILVVVLLFLTALIHFYLNHPRNFAENTRVLLIFGSILLQLAILRSMIQLVDGNWLPFGYVYLLTPMAFAPMLLSILLGRAFGMFAVVCSSLFGALLVEKSEVFSYIIVSLVIGTVGVYVTNQIRKRSRLVRAGLHVGLASLALGLVVGYIDAFDVFDPAATNWQKFGWQCLIPLGIGIATSTVVGGVLPIAESMFKVTTDISWIEQADLNHPLLRRMTLEAPGTYHHSLVVATLSEAAAERIGANATMCRVCSYFHDIGKLVKPGYYIENITEEDNPHEELTPNMSMLIITAHVKDGVDMAIKNKLNHDIIDVIEEHHGTSLVYYFYRRALDQQEQVRDLVREEKANEEDVPEVDEKSFRYPGPKPRTRESGIISLADAVEGASRTLQKPTPQKIEQLVDEIVRGRARDGQLDECELTMHELAEIKSSFCATLRSMLHNRISYPKEDQDERDEKKKRRRSEGRAVAKQKRDETRRAGEVGKPADGKRAEQPVSGATG